MKTITSWLSLPYYFNPTIKFKLKISFAVGLFVFLFLYIFRPFYLVSLGDLILNYTAGIGFVTFIGVFLLLYLPALIFTEYFNEDNWTIGRNIFLITIGILINGILIWYIGSLFNNFFNVENISLFQFLIYTYLVGTIPVVFFVFINEKNVRVKRVKKANKINTFNQQKENDIKIKLNETITIYSDNKKEHLKLNIHNLVYITSQGNYASFFLLNNNDLKEKILRVTLAKIENEFKDYNTIIRCHKSYIINSKFIEDISGNARGYLLKSKHVSFNIPVSRSFNKQSLTSLLC